MRTTTTKAKRSKTGAKGKPPQLPSLGMRQKEPVTATVHPIDIVYEAVRRLKPWVLGNSHRTLEGLLTMIRAEYGCDPRPEWPAEFLIRCIERLLSGQEKVPGR